MRGRPTLLQNTRSPPQQQGDGQNNPPGPAGAPTGHTTNARHGNPCGLARILRMKASYSQFDTTTARRQHARTELYCLPSTARSANLLEFFQPSQITIDSPPCL